MRRHGSGSSDLSEQSICSLRFCPCCLSFALIIHIIIHINFVFLVLIFSSSELLTLCHTAAALALISPIAHRRIGR